MSIIIKENKINFNDKSTITYSGEVLDFEKFANCFDKILQKLIKEIALLNARNKSKI